MLHSKKCKTPGCDRQFTFHGKPHKDLAAICPDCGATTDLTDARKVDPDAKPAAAAATEAK